MQRLDHSAPQPLQAAAIITSVGSGEILAVVGDRNQVLELLEFHRFLLEQAAGSFSGREYTHQFLWAIARIVPICRDLRSEGGIIQ